MSRSPQSKRMDNHVAPPALERKNTTTLNKCLHTIRELAQVELKQL